MKFKISFLIMAVLFTCGSAMALENRSTNQMDRENLQFSNFKITKIEDTAATDYFQYVDPIGQWYIMKSATSAGVSTFTYVTGTSDAATAWDNRASQTYDDFNSTF